MEQLKTKLKPIRCLIFDIGNVLIYFDHGLMISQVAKALGRPREEVEKWLIEEENLMKIEVGKIDFDDLFSELASHSNIDMTSLKHAFCDIFKANWSLLEKIEGYRNRGFKLMLLSNTNKPHFDFLQEKFSISNLFDEQILSYQVQAMKPDRKIFETAIEKSGFDAAECFYTDDIANYVEAAQLLGIRAVKFSNTSQFINDLELILQA